MLRESLDRLLQRVSCCHSLDRVLLPVEYLFYRSYIIKTGTFVVSVFFIVQICVICEKITIFVGSKTKLNITEKDERDL